MNLGGHRAEVGFANGAAVGQKTAQQSQLTRPLNHGFRRKTHFLAEESFGALLRALGSSHKFVS
ncbi:MAG: hypothetical protein ILNGONEN_02306 [Syntrophorhabdaceae bacterium]|nr:hypothetical protein [Syntrophorhabdaceae bacterium]